jgi:type III pantothenate kinase
VTCGRFTVDVGNSSIGVGCWREGRVDVERFRDPQQAAARLQGDIVVVSVAPERLAALLAALSAERRESVRCLRSAPHAMGPAELLASAGADRIAAALAARPGPAVVVDAGTAVTVEIVDAAGLYVGGFIGPGPAAAASGLAGETELLPRLAGERVPLVPGTTTRAALSAGLWGLAVGGVDRLVDAARAALASAPAPRIVATGGWGADWARDSRHAGIAVDGALVHRGIALWAGWDRGL